ncbi:glycoside hydrolase family 2 protein [Chaetomium fimeti]|uniref:Glycoside hydrolase family 2 protein n=1 Tax=Chaetomium fimeti TaxID=1854472 RepID=A0AAE0H5A2_9PEZI|nr:glycoside hydrolase family 2 protein [Chaetomium fimeti]
MHPKRAAIAIFFAAQAQTGVGALVSSPGETVPIPSWDLQSSADAGTDLEALSQTGLDTASWHHVETSKCTLMGCLIEAGVYDQEELFYSENLRSVDEKQFSVPWIYRNEFSLEPGSGKHFFLQTHGISSRADITLNGKPVATSSEQVGSYVGRNYDITEVVGTDNALAIQVHPTDYYHDLALGWVDWNPWPADNGTGIWRDIEIKQTGAVMLEPLRVVTQLGPTLGDEPANITLKARAHNLEDTPITITATALITPDSGDSPITVSETFTLDPLSTTDLILTTTLPNPQIWWPRQWGAQPLYTATLTTTPANTTTPSDHTTATFGLRTVTTTLNAHNDTTFHINARPFQVLGAGYTPNLFLRFSPAKWDAELRYALDLGLNTIRLEGKDEHPALYAAADRAGVMLLAGWECCDKWEAWSYNPDLAVSPVPVWDDEDYAVAREGMAHEGGMMQAHPSVLGFLVGSDYWPDERATKGYLEAFEAVDWQLPVLGSASERGFSEQTGPSGMKMAGPYDWVPPGYWWDTEPAEERFGAAFGFGSELGAGVGTPELGSLTKFLGGAELEDLWKSPNKSLYHMSRETSQFETREIYNAGLWSRWGAPTSLDDYLMKAQLLDYEATRAEIEAYTAMWNAEHPATGLIYWMLNNAWPSLHWNLWDYYMRPAGSYFGAKVGLRMENAAFDYVKKAVWLVNRSLDKQGERRVEVEVMDLQGTVVHKESVATATTPNTSENILSLAEVLGNATDVVFLRLVLYDAPVEGNVLSRNVYWVAKEPDVLDWASTTWYHTPVTTYSDYTALNELQTADVDVHGVWSGDAVDVTLENKSEVPAFFVSLNLVNQDGADLLPVTWEDNYVTLWPGESITLRAGIAGASGEPKEIVVVGKNVARVNTGV